MDKHQYTFNSAKKQKKPKTIDKSFFDSVTISRAKEISKVESPYKAKCKKNHSNSKIIISKKKEVKNHIVIKVPLEIRQKPRLNRNLYIQLSKNK